MRREGGTGMKHWQVMSLDVTHLAFFGLRLTSCVSWTERMGGGADFLRCHGGKLEK